MPEAAAETPVEVGQVVEADLERDLGDASPCGAGAEQERPRTLQPLLTHEFREARALALEEHADIAGTQAVARRDFAERHIILDVREYIVLDGSKATGSNAAA